MTFKAHLRFEWDMLLFQFLKLHLKILMSKV